MQFANWRHAAPYPTRRIRTGRPIPAGARRRGHPTPSTQEPFFAVWTSPLMRGPKAHFAPNLHRNGRADFRRRGSWPSALPPRPHRRRDPQHRHWRSRKGGRNAVSLNRRPSPPRACPDFEGHETPRFFGGAQSVLGWRAEPCASFLSLSSALLSLFAPLVRLPPERRAATPLQTPVGAAAAESSALPEPERRAAQQHAVAAARALQPPELPGNGRC